MSARPVSSSSAFGNQRQEEVLETENGRFSTLIPKVLHNITRLAVPIILVSAMTSIPGADAGPLAYSACIIGCIPVISGLAGPASASCMMWCAAFIPLPGP